MPSAPTVPPPPQASDLDRLYAKLTAKGNKATTARRVHALIGAA
ncbi:MAG: hypothetical protein ACRDV4_08455 [Acidimicrobiales bacterium]